MDDFGIDLDKLLDDFELKENENDVTYVNGFSDTKIQSLEPEIDSFKEAPTNYVTTNTNIPNGFVDENGKKSVSANLFSKINELVGKPTLESPPVLETHLSESSDSEYNSDTPCRVNENLLNYNIEANFSTDHNSPINNEANNINFHEHLLNNYENEPSYRETSNSVISIENVKLEAVSTSPKSIELGESQTFQYDGNTAVPKDKKSDDDARFEENFIIDAEKYKLSNFINNIEKSPKDKNNDCDKVGNIINDNEIVIEALDDAKTLDLSYNDLTGTGKEDIVCLENLSKLDNAISLQGLLEEDFLMEKSEEDASNFYGEFIKINTHTLNCEVQCQEKPVQCDQLNGGSTENVQNVEQEHLLDNYENDCAKFVGDVKEQNGENHDHNKNIDVLCESIDKNKDYDDKKNHVKEDGGDDGRNDGDEKKSKDNDDSEDDEILNSLRQEAASYLNFLNNTSSIFVGSKDINNVEIPNDEECIKHDDALGCLIDEKLHQFDEKHEEECGNLNNLDALESVSLKHIHMTTSSSLIEPTEIISTPSVTATSSTSLTSLTSMLPTLPMSLTSSAVTFSSAAPSVISTTSVPLVSLPLAITSVMTLSPSSVMSFVTLSTTAISPIETARQSSPKKDTQPTTVARRTVVGQEPDETPLNNSLSTSTSLSSSLSPSSSSSSSPSSPPSSSLYVPPTSTAQPLISSSLMQLSSQMTTALSSSSSSSSSASISMQQEASENLPEECQQNQNLKQSTNEKVDDVIQLQLQQYQIQQHQQQQQRQQQQPVTQQQQTSSFRRERHIQQRHKQQQLLQEQLLQQLKHEPPTQPPDKTSKPPCSLPVLHHQQQTASPPVDQPSVHSQDQLVPSLLPPTIHYLPQEQQQQLQPVVQQSHEHYLPQLHTYQYQLGDDQLNAETEQQPATQPTTQPTTQSTTQPTTPQLITPTEPQLATQTTSQTTSPQSPPQPATQMVLPQPTTPQPTTPQPTTPQPTTPQPTTQALPPPQYEQQLPPPYQLRPPSTTTTPRLQFPPPRCSNIDLPITELGKVSPAWLPDSSTMKCLQCEVPFSFLRRRHHCRACGLIFCSVCCNVRHPLAYMENREERVCCKCFVDFNRASSYHNLSHQQQQQTSPSSSSSSPQTPPPASSSTSSYYRPNPNNPSEYCSTIPPSLQASPAEPLPPVLVPTGVLRKHGTTRQSGEAKQVIFSDGIRPGGDLTHLDGRAEGAGGVAGRRRKGHKQASSSSSTTPAATTSSPARVSTTATPPSSSAAAATTSSATSKKVTPPSTLLSISGMQSSSSSSSSAVPPMTSSLSKPLTSSSTPTPSLSAFASSSGGLLPLVVTCTPNKSYQIRAEVTDDDVIHQLLKGEQVDLCIHPDVIIHVKIIKKTCCVMKQCLYMQSDGLYCVGQDEVIFLVETSSEESTTTSGQHSVIVDAMLLVLHTIAQIYQSALSGCPVKELGLTIMPSSLNGKSSSSSSSRGFLYIKQTFQCVQHLTLPPPPYLFAVYVHSNELMWAHAFPLRLVFRLGAEFRYYPCPLVSRMNRPAVYGEVGHTIMNLLVDFRNFQYTMNKIDDLVIHVEEKKTTVIVPAYNINQVRKLVSDSDEHVVAISGNFSSMADSHLVCLQNSELNYQTQAINIQGRPRSVTGASFIVFNGALKSSLGMRAKSSIIEDGLMVQLTPDDMVRLKQALLNSTSFTIKCGLLKPTDATHDAGSAVSDTDDVVEIKWMSTRPDKTFDIRSPIDGLNLSSYPCVQLHNNSNNKKHLHKSSKLNWDIICVCLYYLHKNQKSSPFPLDLSSDAELEKVVGDLIHCCRKAMFAELSTAKCSSHTRVCLRIHVGLDQIGYETGTNSSVKLSQSCLFTLDDTIIPLLHQSGLSSRSMQVDMEMVFVVMRPVDQTT